VMHRTKTIQLPSLPREREKVCQAIATTTVCLDDDRQRLLMTMAKKKKTMMMMALKEGVS